MLLSIIYWLFTKVNKKESFVSLYSKDSPKGIKAKRFGFMSESGAFCTFEKQQPSKNLTCVRLWRCSFDKRKKCFWKSYIIEMKRYTFAFITKLVKIGLWLKIYLITCLRAALTNVFMKESILRFTFLNKRYYKTSVVLKSQGKSYHFNIDLKSYF